MPILDTKALLRHQHMTVEDHIPQSYLPLYASLLSSVVIPKPTPRRWRWSRRDVLTTADPRMIQAVISFSGALENPAFGEHADFEQFNSNDSRLESSAILSLTLRPLVRRLLAGGVEAMKVDMKNARQSNSTAGILSLQGVRQHRPGLAVLAPSHVVGGLVDVSSIGTGSRSQGVRERNNTTVAFSALGGYLRTRPLSIAMDTQAHDFVQVKQEEA
ncbi:hypothetical protein OF83DRAFT_1175528 [Amylostereum chailletii]|nr:hypothetical protein OF83DRAFT_1175528 [Amylostereum chailletii]